MVPALQLQPLMSKTQKFRGFFGFSSGLHQFQYRWFVCGRSRWSRWSRWSSGKSDGRQLSHRQIFFSATFGKLAVWWNALCGRENRALQSAATAATDTDDHEVTLFQRAHSEHQQRQESYISIDVMFLLAEKLLILLWQLNICMRNCVKPLEEGALLMPTHFGVTAAFLPAHYTLKIAS